MLGTLVKHEWKDSWKVMFILNLTVLILSVIGIVFLNADKMLELFDDSAFAESMEVFVYSSYTMIYVLSIIVLSIGSTLYFYIRFYRNLYTDQGYLMHTLPVTPGELIWSKAIVAIIWRLIGIVIMAIGICSVLFAFFELRFGADIKEEIRELVDEIFEMGPEFVVSYIVIGIIAGIGSLFFSVFKGYTAISIGQLASKNKVLASVGAYFGLHIVISLMSNILTQSTMFVMLRSGSDLLNYFEEPGWFMVSAMAVAAVLIYILCIVCFVVTRVIMSNHLNLE